MKRPNRLLIAIGAVVVLIALAAAVIALVLDAQTSGIETREELRLEQVRSEANRMEALVQSSFTSLAATSGEPGLWNLTPNDPEDAERLQPPSAQSRTGRVLVDRDGVVLNGSLLRDPAVVGTTLERDGLQAVLDGTTAILPIAEGLTTTLPTIATAVPVRDAAGRLAGAVLTESEVAADSGLNTFIVGVPDDNSSMSYVDQNGAVLASNDFTLLGESLDVDVADGFELGFHRGDGRVAAIAEVPTAGWHLVFLQDIGDFEGDLTGPLQTALLLFLGAVAIVGVLGVAGLLRRLQAAREEQRRLQEIGDAREEFTSIVSHELRTPVAGLLGFLQTTIDHWDAMADGERKRAVGRAFANAQSLQTLTSDVLDSAGIEAKTLVYRFETFDVGDCIVDTVATIRDAAPDRPISFTKPAEPVLVRGDALRIRQVLINLLDNATKSSAADAPIDIEVHVDGRLASVSVRDRGPGIADDEQEKVFDKFTRGRSGLSRGSGLGLYISRHIVEEHGGTIRAESVDGEPGARLTFTIPLA